jgi:hypothetical protein
LEVVNQRVRVDAKAVVHRGDKVIGRDRIGVGIGANLIGRAECVSAAEAAAGDDSAESLRPVVAAGGVVEASQP